MGGQSRMKIVNNGEVIAVGSAKELKQTLNIFEKYKKATDNSSPFYWKRHIGMGIFVVVYLFVGGKVFTNFEVFTIFMFLGVLCCYLIFESIKDKEKKIHLSNEGINIPLFHCLDTIYLENNKNFHSLFNYLLLIANQTTDVSDGFNVILNEHGEYKIVQMVY